MVVLLLVACLSDVNPQKITISRHIVNDGGTKEAVSSRGGHPESVDDEFVRRQGSKVRIAARFQ